MSTAAENNTSSTESAELQTDRKSQANAKNPSHSPSGTPFVVKVRHHDSGGGAAQFRSNKGDNSVQESGHEADALTLERAAAALHGYLDAGARRDAKTACSYLSKTGKETPAAYLGERNPSAKKCVTDLTALWAHVAPRNLAQAAEADVGSFRVQGPTKGLLLYHGADHLDFSMPMVYEAGQWKVGTLSASELP